MGFQLVSILPVNVATIFSFILKWLQDFLDQLPSPVNEILEAFSSFKNVFSEGLNQGLAFLGSGYLSFQ